MSEPMSFSRRDALRRMALAGAVGALGSIARATEPPNAGYIDIHIHLGTYLNEVTPLTAEQLLRWMDANGVAKACILPLVSPESFRLPISSEDVLALTAPYRDRLIPFCCIDPRNSWVNTKAAIAKQLEAYKSLGARGFGEHKVATPIDDPRNMALFAGCADCELPVLFHIDNVRNTDVPGLPGLEKVLKTYPKLPFIGHALGIWSSLSGGITQKELGSYPKGKMQPGGAIDRLLDTYDNFYCDLSAGSGENAFRRDPDFMREFLIRRQDRVLFGTDYLDTSMKPEQFELIAELKLPNDVFRKLASENARNLLRLS